MVVLFTWNGESDLVRDLDYVLYGNSTNAMDKSGVTVGTSMYAADTAVGSQGFTSTPSSGRSLNRCDVAEGTESQSGGNGYTGADETSENLSTTWQNLATQTPGLPPICL